MLVVAYSRFALGLSTSTDHDKDAVAALTTIGQNNERSTRTPV